MGLVKSQDELKALAEAFRNPSFEDAREISVEFLTDREAVERLLPPGLEPGPEALAYARVGSFRANVFGPYMSAGIQIAARHGDRPGRYVVGLYTSAHSPMTYGREFFDEPKKDANITFHADAESASGTATRHGTRLIDIDVTLGDDAGPGTGAVSTFNYRFRCPWNDINAGQALLRAANFTVERHIARAGTGRVTLRGSDDDPIDELPVREVRGFTYFEGRMLASVEDLETIPGDTYLPYAFARYDDWSRCCGVEDGVSVAPR